MDHILIASRRRLLGLSQVQVAAAAGLSADAFRRFERHGVDIGLDAFKRLLAALALDLRIEPASERRHEDWEGFLAASQARLSKQARSYGSPAESVEKARFFPGKNAKVLSWGKY